MSKDVAPKSISIRPLSRRLSLEDGDDSYKREKRYDGWTDWRFRDEIDYWPYRSVTEQGDTKMKYRNSPDLEVQNAKQADVDRQAWLSDMQDEIAQGLRDGTSDVPLSEALTDGMNSIFAECIRRSVRVDRDDPDAMRNILDDLQAEFDDAVELYAYEVAGRIPR